MTDKPELLPCPFCGRDADRVTRNTLAGSLNYVRCSDETGNCAGFNGSHQEQWNTRSPLPTGDKSQALDALDEIVSLVSNADYKMNNVCKREETIRAALTDRSDDVQELVEGLKLVLNTVADCHDCWSMSATDEQREYIEKLISKHIQKAGE